MPEPEHLRTRSRGVARKARARSRDRAVHGLCAARQDGPVGAMGTRRRTEIHGAGGDTLARRFTPRSARDGAGGAN